MSGFLKKYLFYEYCKIFSLVLFLFLPIIYFADFLFSGSMDSFNVLLRVPFRYGQMIGVLSFICSYVAIKKILYVHGTWIFISLRYKKSDFLFSLLYLAFILSVVFYNVIVPLNDKVFNCKNYISPWAVIKEENNIKFIYNDYQHQCYDIWEIEKGSMLKNYQEKLELSDYNFYIVWNETKKMSMSGLAEYRKYMERHKFSLDEYYKQKQIYYSRSLAVFVMLLCGFIAAWRTSFLFFFACFLIFNWLDLLAFFLPLKYCIVLLWGNLLVWLIVGLLGVFL